ncbi:putative flavoprotein involved in K+ transport [Rhodococcus sp. 27YEA15]|uniref:flavin-containing monooxygenase n=1 Tax=Rhodococcus sp. 27YEA15 TaxID=3156259 RepID=UPI003C7E35EE
MSMATTSQAMGERMRTEDAERTARSWIDGFHAAASGSDGSFVDELFVEDSWWRDILARSWDFETIRGVDAIGGAIGDGGLTNVRLDETASPRLVESDAGEAFIEAIFLFDTTHGAGRGVVRLEILDGTWKASTLFTTLQDLRGLEQRRGHRRPVRIPEVKGSALENWADWRRRTSDFEDSSPTVVIIGGGHNGLMTAAHLGFWGVDTLVIEKSPRIGDNWRNRYRSLVLHDAIWADHFPGMSFPDSWPVYMPKDKLADWLEFYASAMEINVWAGAELEESSYDDATQRWTLTVRRSDGTFRTLSPTDVVIATGVHGEPNTPEFAGREAFTGKVVHSSHYRGDEVGPGDRAVVVGAGNSAHDAAQNLHANGVGVTMLQRSSTYIVSQKSHYSQTIGKLYHENGMPTEDADLVQASTPNLLALERGVELTRRMADLDRDMLDGLERAGYRFDMGVGGAGVLSKILSGPGSYYLDVGCAELIASGKVRLEHAEVRNFTANGVVLTDGTELDAELVVLATGYKNMRETARRILGDDAADRCDPVWGMKADGEISGMWRRSGHPGLWFQGGPLYMARFYSRFLALQLHGLKSGLMDRR